MYNRAAAPAEQHLSHGDMPLHSAHSHADCVFLRVAHAAILHGGEHGGGHSVVVHLECGASVQATGQANAGLDGHWGQLLAALKHVTNGIDVGHIGLLILNGDLACEQRDMQRVSPGWSA